MTAPVYDFVIEQGATLSKTVTVEGLNLTGATARMQARRNHADTAVAVDLDSASKGGIVLTITDTNNATLAITISATSTAILTARLLYDLEVVLADGTVYRLLQGKIVLSREITR